MNIENASPFPSARTVSDDELVELLANDVASDWVERMFATTAEELDAMNDTDLQSLSAGSLDKGAAARFVDAIADDVAERALDHNLDRIVDARFVAPHSAISSHALQSVSPFEVLSLSRKIGRGLKRVGSKVRKALKGLLKRLLVEAGKRAIPAIIGLLKTAVPDGVVPQGWFSDVRRRASGLIRKGKAAIKDAVKEKARDFVRAALRRVDGFLQEKISTFSTDASSGAAPAAPAQNGNSDNNFFWEQQQTPAPFSADVPMATPPSDNTAPLFI